MPRLKNSYLTQALGLLVLAGLLAGLASLVVPFRKPPPPRPAPAAQAGRIVPVGLARIDQVLKAKPLILDLRTPDLFRAGRLPGAVQKPPESLPAGRAILVYGQGDDQDRVVSQAQALAERGLGPVYVFMDGAAGWRAAGRKLAQGDEP